jgi:hypothetical protein
MSDRLNPQDRRSAAGRPAAAGRHRQNSGLEQGQLPACGGNPACARTRQQLWFDGTMEGNRDHRQVRGNSQVGLRRRS